MFILGFHISVGPLRYFAYSERVSRQMVLLNVFSRPNSAMKLGVSFALNVGVYFMLLSFVGVNPITTQKANLSDLPKEMVTLIGEKQMLRKSCPNNKRMKG